MKLKISLLQTDQQWENVEANLAAASVMAERAEGSLLVLPEMFATGFSMNARVIAEKAEEGPIYEWMLETSRRTGKAIIGSVAVCEEREERTLFFNRLYFVTPVGETFSYDKKHLFPMSREDEVYTPGDMRLIVEWEGFRILPVICYDLRFPVWTRNHGQYDIFLDVASWAEPRRDVWLTLLKARAIENVCYSVGVNRVGDDPDAHYSGDSIVYDFKGRTVAAADRDREQIIEVELDKDDLLAFRQKFPVLKDADEFMLL